MRRSLGAEPGDVADWRRRGALVVLLCAAGCSAYDQDLLPSRSTPPGPGPAMDGGSRDAAPGQSGADASGDGAGPEAGVTPDDDAGSTVECRPNPNLMDEVCPEICPERCNGEDDDCDLRIDEEPATASCAADNATTSCVEGACAVDSCEGDFLDCDGAAETGCEVDRTQDPAHCGDCDTDCTALPNTDDTGCGAGFTCEIVTCAEGFESCDADAATGCETPIFGTSDCGGCASTGDNETCTGLTRVTASSCPAGSCQVDDCESGWADCDGSAANGCEHDENALGACTPSLVQITIDDSHVDAALTDFPVLVRFTDAALSASRADGLDLLFTTDGSVDAAALLPFEVVAWDQASGTLVAWVRVASVSDTAPTVFYLRYADGVDHSGKVTATDVWSASYASVHHFDGDLNDSTDNGIDGTNAGSSSEPAGHIGGARSFGGNAGVDMGAGRFANTQYYTLSAWVRATLAGGSTYKYVMDTSTTGAPYDGMALGIEQGTGAVTAYVGAAWQVSPTDFVPDATWTFVAVRYDIGTGGSFESSVNGEPFQVVFSGNTQDAQNLPTSPFRVGRWAGSQGFFFDGSIDELRVASTSRSNAWMRAEYENQRTGSSFLAFEVQ